MTAFGLSLFFEIQLFPLMTFCTKILSEKILSLSLIVIVGLQESFDPIVDATTGRDLIPAMVYG